MSRPALAPNLFAIAWLGLAACGHGGSAPASDRLLASVPAATDSVTPSRDRAPAGRQPRPLPADVQQDPQARVMRLQQIRLPIVNRVKALPEPQYREVVRPRLGRQLKEMGFDDADVAYFLSDLDRSRR